MHPSPLLKTSIFRYNWKIMKSSSLFIFATFLLFSYPINAADSFIFTGNKLEDVDTDVIMKLRELADDELEYRMTGIPKGQQIH